MPPRKKLSGPATSALDTLTLKEKAFVNAIATPGSPTFSNGSASAVVAGYAPKEPSHGGRMAYELRNKPVIVAAIDEVFNKANLTIQVRSGVLKDILSNRTTDVEQIGKNGETKQRTRMTNAKYQLQAIRELNRMDGTYARAEAVGHAQGKALEPIIEDYTRRLRAELREAAKIGHEGGVEGQTIPPQDVEVVPTEGTEPTTSLLGISGVEIQDGSTVIHTDEAPGGTGTEDKGEGGMPTPVVSDE